SMALLERSVERVVEEGGLLQGLAIILGDEGKPAGDGQKACTLGRGVERVEIGTVDDHCEGPERGVVRAPLLDERLKRAPARFVLMGISSARRVEPDRALLQLNVGNLIGIDEEKFCLRIDETPDQPGGRCPIDLDSPSSHPLHGTAPSATWGVR